MEFRRRDVLRLMGFSIAAAALPGCKQESHNLIPYLLPDDEIIPGVANWYATICQECEAGCGTIVRVLEGRAKKIEGNPAHPLNKGKLCAKGQSSLQALYNPDRLKSPLRRMGPRGEGRFEPLTWSEAIEACRDIVRESPASLLVGRAAPGSESTLLDHFMKTVKGTALFYTPEDTISLRKGLRTAFEFDGLPAYDLAHCDYLLSIGAPFLEYWLSPVSLSAGFGAMRQERQSIRGRFVQVEPRLSATGASADRWIPIRPGTEVWLVRALTKLLWQAGRVGRNFRNEAKWLNELRDLTIDEIADTIDVSVTSIRDLASELLEARAPLILAGGTSSDHTNGTDLIIETLALNAMLGSVNRPGGMQLGRPIEFSAGPSAVGEQALMQALGRLADREGALFLHQTDLLHVLPTSLDALPLLRRCRQIVSFASFPDDTTMMADLVLPVHTALESWGDRTYAGLTGVPAVGLQQPVVQPLFESRQIGDLIIELARLLGESVQAELPWQSFHAYLQERWKGRADTTHETDQWIHHLQQGGRWAGTDSPVTVTLSAPPSREPAAFAGDPLEFPFYLLPYPSSGLHRGEGANRPWLQELPDPLTAAVWGSWIELNPVTARTLALSDGDVARVLSPYGAVEAPVVISPGARPDTIAMPLGQGHAAYGRYASNRGVNPTSLLAPLFDRRSGHLASGATRVRIERTGRQARLVRMENPGEGDGTSLIHIERLRRRPGYA
ncbi:hypothetical protein W02_31020 [Nitrospira sp. KM1]|uniref:molybdopterin-containing oxidoreductase family protein n=1 Tax=Nitrospira sp. KM1 TaxID=1936990 RepID=UPI0013A728A5|nr:molybdopterin-dependent oxidoreductase [Nitrospira sp. KM1]BCA55962.1 hypothetical protein W02_31020 [Nitrospira sp. KM1]